MRKLFKDWNKFEIIWLILSTIIMCILSIIWKDSLLALISGVTGILGVVLAAKGRISTYFFATINVASYAYITFNNHLYGEFMLNAFYYIPMNILGYYLWTKHKNKESNEILCKSLKMKQLIVLLLIVLLVVVFYWRILTYIGGQLTLIDSISTVLSVIALILQILRFAEQWLLWIIVNVVSVVMWGLLIGKDSSAITMVVMWTSYLINSIYGYYNWKKISLKNTENK